MPGQPTPPPGYQPAPPVGHPPAGYAPAPPAGHVPPGHAPPGYVPPGYVPAPQPGLAPPQQGFAAAPPGYAGYPPPPGHASVQGPPPEVARATAAKGWWRRNLWGLIALLPILALALGPSAKEALDLYNRVDAHEAVLPGADGWVTYSGMRMRLVDFGPAADLKSYDGTPWQPPARTKVWRAKITVDVGDKWATDKYAAGGCNLRLEDTEGRQFTANPTELSGSDPSRRVASCSPEDDDTPTPWEVEIYFVLPESAQPAALRIVRGTDLPRYARLPVS